MTGGAPRLPALLAILLLLSGCSAPFDAQSPSPADPTPEADPGAGTDVSTAASESGTATPDGATATTVSDVGTATSDGTTATDAPPETTAADATPVERRKNPWGEDPIVVAVERPDDREVASLVREATGFWEARAERYAGFPVRYEVRPDAADPDVVVTFVENVSACGGAADVAGCAPYITDAREIDRPARIYVRTGLAADSTELVLKHEFGHTLGLDHDDGPQEVMRESAILYTEPQPNATERAFPWSDPNFTVYADYDGAADPDGAAAQIEAAFDYYEGGADGSVPDNLTFAFVDSPEAADVVIRFSETSPCGEGPGSCARTAGADPDGDGAVERYERLEVTLVELDTEAVGWHVGNWFAYALGREDPDERPEPFRDADYDDRRSEWWREEE